MILMVVEIFLDGFTLIQVWQMLVEAIALLYRIHNEQCTCNGGTVNSCRPARALPTRSSPLTLVLMALHVSVNCLFLYSDKRLNYSWVRKFMCIGRSETSER